MCSGRAGRLGDSDVVHRVLVVATAPHPEDELRERVTDTLRGRTDVRSGAARTVGSPLAPTSALAA
jgi:hypothetical protein